MAEPFDLDALLPRALTDANLLQFQKTLDRAEAWEPDFSPRYRRSRMRLLRDPAAWARERARPLWRRTLQTAACVLLACAVALGSLMAVSPTVRATVIHWIREITEGEIDYRPGEAKTGLPPSWRPGWLPEGCYLSDIMSLEDRTMWTLDTPLGRLRLSCHSPGSSGFGQGITEETVHERVTVQGVPADLYTDPDLMFLVWESPQGHLLTVSLYSTDRAALERIAENMRFYTGAEERYEVTWLPGGEDAVEMEFFENIGTGQFQWLADGDILTFQYVTDPPCDFSYPDRPWEEVTVNGLPARYWPCLLPEEEAGSGQTKNIGDSAQVITGIIHGPAQSAILLWEDPETHTVLQITGILDREEILRMAEGVRRVPLESAE